ncbi:MAG: uracil-DNA glycosylase [Bacillota bacterium]
MIGELAAAYQKERERLIAFAKESPLRGEHASPVFGEGPDEPLLMLVGEAPGREETAAGKPFVGKAGKQLNGLLERARIDRAGVYLTNAVKFRPVRMGGTTVANRAPAREEIESSLWLLEKEISLLRPRVVATLGNIPLGAILALTGEKSVSIGSAHAAARTVSVGGVPITLFPMYHPASGIYNRDLIPVLEADADALGALLSAQKEAK